MSTWCLDHTLTSDLNRQKSTLSALFSVPHHPTEHGITQTREDIESALKSQGVLTGLGTSFEYIVVGGGTAGLTLASRLAESLKDDQYVCVIEAGTYHRDPIIDVPGAFGMAVGDKDYDWSYETVPQENLNNRRVSSSAGRLLGGSSGINYLVRMRASSPEYDAWKQFGAGWGWEDLLPHFKAEESYTAYIWGTDEIFPGITKEEDEEARRKEPEFRGHSGPVYSTHNTIYTDLLVPTINTTRGNEFKIKTNRTPGYGDSTGMFNIDTAVNRKTGTRSYAANAYLQDPTSTMPQPHVVVLKGVYATKILFDPLNSNNDAKATGLQCVTGIDWKFPINPVPSFELTANKEVIVSAGSYSTPRLLELSGIGKPDVLSKFNITPVYKLKGVGENLQEHPFVISDFVVKDTVFTLDKLRNDPVYRAQQAQEYADKRTGAYATTVSAYGFFKLKNFLTPSEVNELKADMQRQIDQTTDAFYKQQLELQKGFLEDDGVGDVELIMVPKVFISVPEENKSYISLVVALPHPVARGSVHISSSNPSDPPNINPNYLNNTLDTKILTKATMFARKLSETEPLKSIIVNPSTPGPDIRTEAQFEQFVRNYLSSVQHPIGTASMAPESLGGVVDKNLRVYGTQNVRVVDMSIAPLHLAAHLVDTAYAIGEKGAALIKAGLGHNA